MKIGFHQCANFITLLRIIGVFVIFSLTPYVTNLQQFWVVIIYTFICLTDFLDGWVARKFKIVTDLGKILDPFADKIVVLIFLPLLELRVISSFPVFLIFAREFAIMTLRIMSAKEGTLIAAKLSGKIKTAITLPLCGVLLGRVPVEEVSLPFYFIPLNALRRWIFDLPNWIFVVLIWLMVAITIWSFLDYFGSYIWQTYVKRFKGDEKKARHYLFLLIPNIFTILNFSCGIVAALCAWYDLFNTAALLVLLGILFDAMDGSVARKLKASSRLGEFLDSKADFMSFAIAPAVVIFKHVSGSLADSPGVIGFGLAILYYSAVYYRLYRFNKNGHTPYFQGLPSPVGASLVVLSSISYILSHLNFFIPIVLATSLLMISTIPYPHLEAASKRPFLRFLRIPTFIFFMLTLLHLLDIHVTHIFVYEVLFGLTGVYVIAPAFVRRIPY